MMSIMYNNHISRVQQHSMKLSQSHTYRLDDRASIMDIIPFTSTATTNTAVHAPTRPPNYNHGTSIDDFPLIPILCPATCIEILLHHNILTSIIPHAWAFYLIRPLAYHYFTPPFPVVPCRSPYHYLVTWSTVYARVWSEYNNMMDCEMAHHTATIAVYRGLIHAHAYHVRKEQKQIFEVLLIHTELLPNLIDIILSYDPQPDVARHLIAIFHTHDDLKEQLHHAIPPEEYHTNQNCRDEWWCCCRCWCCVFPCCPCQPDWVK